MIHKVKISNFKSINELELELGRVNVLIGENGCGKTNILEAIVLGSVRAYSDIYFEDTLLAARGFRVTNLHLIKSAFNGEDDFDINLIFTNIKNEGVHVTTHREQLNEVNSFFHTGLDFQPELDIGDNLMLLLGKERKRLEFKQIQDFFGNQDLYNFTIFCPENYFLRRFEEEGQIKPLGTRGEGLFKHLVKLHREHPEIIKKMNEKLRLIDWFGGFEIPNELMFTETRLNIKDRYLEGLEYFDQRSANEGFLHLLFYFTLFMSPYTPGFFAVDNIDTALNPKLAARLIKELTIIAKENNKQVLLTTHNPGLLDGLDLEDDAQRLFSIYRDIDGETSAYRIEPPKPVIGVEPVRLSEAFIRGYLGGIPSNF